MFIEKKIKLVKIKIICNVLNYSNQLISDTIENQLIWRNQRSSISFKKVPDYYYNFNDFSLNDFYGQASDLIAKNGVEFDSDRFGYANSAVKFDGKKSHLRYTDIKNLIFFKNNFTISFWAKPFKNAAAGIDNLIHPIQLDRQSGRSIGLGLFQDQVYISSQSDRNNHIREIFYGDFFTDWNQFTICVSDNKIALFVDGKFCKSSNIISGDLYFSLAYCKYYQNSGLGVAYDDVGNSANIFSYSGLLDDLVLYKSALTNVEILDLFNETK